MIDPILEWMYASSSYAQPANDTARFLQVRTGHQSALARFGRKFRTMRSMLACAMPSNSGWEAVYPARYSRSVMRIERCVAPVEEAPSGPAGIPRRKAAARA